MAASRADGDSEYSTAAEESVSEPPKPVMAWNVRVGLTVTVRSAGGCVLNATGACLLSFCCPSAVVIQTLTWGDDWPPLPSARARAGGAATRPSSRASELAVAVPSASGVLRTVSLSLADHDVGQRQIDQ